SWTGPGSPRSSTAAACGSPGRGRGRRCASRPGARGWAARSTSGRSRTSSTGCAPASTSTRAATAARRPWPGCTTSAVRPAGSSCSTSTGRSTSRPTRARGCSTGSGTSAWSPPSSGTPSSARWPSRSSSARSRRTPSSPSTASLRPRRSSSRRPARPWAAPRCGRARSCAGARAPDPMVETSDRGERLDLRRLLVLVRQRLRGGRRRVRSAFVPVLTAAVAAGLSWSVAFYGLGHAQPFFAPIATWVCLGFSADREVRKVAELALGVALGVALGELVAYTLSTGPLQIVLVITLGALLARFVDRGPMLTIQAGVQGIVIVALPVAAIDGPTGRWTDAIVGGSFALLVAILTPQDARRRARQLAGASLSDLSEMLATLGKGLRDGDAEL